MSDAGLLLKLYVPFCARKCSFCPLPVCGYDAGLVRAHGQAMLAELQAAAEDAEDSVVQAVSIEGGSPCLTPPELLRELLRTIRRRFACAPDLHIGLQTMPGDYSRALMQRMADEGVNFWTVGLASANPEEHKLLGRPYRFDALTMVDTAVRVFPMRDLNFALLYGIPGQTMHSWERSLNAVLAYRPEHLTLRPLILRPGTPLYAGCKSGKTAPCSPEASTELYLYAKQRLEQMGYRGYTIHDFALPGHEDRYRLTLLNGADYIGIGYGADSRVEGIRYRNGHSLQEYIGHSADLSVIAGQVTQIGGAGEVMRHAAFQLALKRGLDDAALQSTFGDCAGPVVNQIFPGLLQEKMLKRRADGRLYLTAGGIASGVLEDVQARFFGGSQIL